ncbi:hypothetical protein R1flu_019917 [Riccia fluitans]|uniref:Uncharacterized protein n=1 Tax=Riccia fluitans TaxID=41844 RepID=A0ABD1ZNI4_9MARC
MAALVGCGDRFAAATVWKQPRQRIQQHGFPFGRHSFLFLGNTGSSVENSSVSRRSVEVRVAADFSDSKPDSSNKRRGKWGYHPLEELTKMEKEELDQAGDGKLTEAEVARTVAEVNWSAVVFSSFISEEDAVFGTEVQYLIDDQGDFYFEVEDDNEFLRNLSFQQIYTVLIGYGSGDNLHFSELIEGALAGEDEDDGDSDEESIELDSEDIEILWEAVEDMQSMTEDMTLEDSFSSLGGWGGFKTLDEVHPMEFAYKVSEAVSADHASDLGKPERRLTITGVARPVSEDEEPYVQGIWYDRFLMASDESDDESDDEDGEAEEPGERRKNALELTSTQEGCLDVGRAHRPKSVGAEGAHSGVVSGKSFNGTAKLSSPGDRIKRTDPLVVADHMWQNIVIDGNEGPVSDGRLIEVGNSSGSPAENLGVRKDMNREALENQEGAIISWDSPANNDTNKQLGAVFEVSEGLDETEVEYSTEIVLPPGTTVDGDTIVVDWAEKPKPTFYKLEILSIRLDRGTGGQSNIEVRDFAFAEPDILAHFSTAIMEKINADGNKVDTALKALVQRCKGLEAEEVSLVGIDCLGVDLRVQFGIEIQTIRVPFSRRATCEESAEKLLDQLLFPRPGQRRSKKKGQQWNTQ